MNTFLRAALAVITLTWTLAGCSTPLIKPWERDLLAQKQMHPVPDPVDTFFDEHIYFSKEASSGGKGVGGGGCGCN